MKHIKADLNQITVVEALYHRTYMKIPLSVLRVTINGQIQDFEVDRRVAKRDRFYHESGLPCKLLCYAGKVIAYVITSYDKDNVNVFEHNLEALRADQSIMAKEWYFDGIGFYGLQDKPSEKFISVTSVDYIDPVVLSYHETFNSILSIDCFLVCKDGQIYTQTRPVHRMLGHYDTINGLTTEIKENFVSLEGMLRVCQIMSRLYGSEEIEKFDIPQYMITYKTVNLRKLPLYIRENVPSTIHPNEMIAYLLGKMYKETNESNISELTFLIRYFAKFGTVDINKSNLSEIIISPVTLKHGHVTK